MEYTLEQMKENLNVLNARILNACKKSNRSPDSVKLIWVSKFHSLEAVKNAIALGATDFGENRVQEAELKFSIPQKTKEGGFVRCHIIGPVQSNKLKKAALVSQSIHSITSISALEKLEKVCSEAQKELDILFQINAGEEETKSGIDIHESKKFLEELEKIAGDNLKKFPHLHFKGLMTIGKNTGVPEDSRICFSFLRKLRDEFLAKGGIFKEFKELSMGMTGDLEVAIEEGSTMIRVGTALFGERDYH